MGTLAPLPCQVTHIRPLQIHWTPEHQGRHCCLTPAAIVILVTCQAPEVATPSQAPQHPIGYPDWISGATKRCTTHPICQHSKVCLSRLPRGAPPTRSSLGLGKDCRAWWVLLQWTDNGKEWRVKSVKEASMTAAIRALARVVVRAWVNWGQRSKLQPPDIQESVHGQVPDRPQVSEPSLGQLQWMAARPGRPSKQRTAPRSPAARLTERPANQMRAFTSGAGADRQPERPE